MSFSIPTPQSSGSSSPAQLHHPSGEGVTTWFNGDIYSIRLTAEQTNGAIGLVEATVPPGGGPAPHVHGRTDETFYLVSGELDFLNGEKTFTAGTGDVVFIPRGTTHRFTNAGIQPARLLFLYTPGGAEGLFVEGGDEPEPGVQVMPWGPDRIDARLLGLLDKYDTGLPPDLA